MSNRIDLLNAGGYRTDGRRQFELRSLSLSIGNSPDPTADGYASISHGLTTVSALVFGPRQPRNQQQHDKAVINVEVSLSPWGGMERRKRNKGDRRLVEFASAVRSTFEPVVHTHLYPRSQIDILITVEQQDGGVLPAAINATTLALMDAGLSMSDFVCALSCGIHSTAPLLDLNHTEESDLPNLTAAVLPRSGKVTLASLETRLHVERFEEIFRLSIDGCKVLHLEMQHAVRARTTALVARMRAAEPEQAQEQDVDI